MSLAVSLCVSLGMSSVVSLFAGTRQRAGAASIRRQLGRVAAIAGCVRQAGGGWVRHRRYVLGRRGGQLLGAALLAGAGAGCARQLCAPTRGNTAAGGGGFVGAFGSWGARG